MFIGGIRALLLQSLHPLFTPTQDDGSKELMDNAAGAVARMILTTPGSMPMHAVLPVFVQALPLTALNDALRAIYNDALPFSGYAVELAILAAWMVIGFVLSLRLFRWQ